MLRRSRLLAPGRFFYASSSPIRRPCHPRILSQGAVRKFATQTGATTPSDRKGSSNQFLKLGFGIAALGAVAAYISIERPDIFKFSKFPSSEKPAENRSEGPFNTKKGDTVEIIGDGNKETGTNPDVTFDGSDGEFDSTHKGSEYVKERNKDDNVHKDLSPTKGKLIEVPSSQVEAYASAELNNKMSYKEVHTSAKSKNASDKEAHISEESHKKASDTESKERNGRDEAVHGAHFTIGDAVLDTGKEDATGGYGLPHDDSEDRIIENSHTVLTGTGRPSLLDSYYLVDSSDGNKAVAHKEEKSKDSESGKPQLNTESSVSSDKKAHNVTLVKDLEIVPDAFTFVEIIHAAEERQAASDARIYNEARKRLKEKYEEELKDARAKELMYAEEASRLEKELAKEKLRASAALKLQQEEAAERLRKELKQKEEELELKLNKSEHLAKAQLAAAIVQEKEAHVRDMKDVQLEVDALNLAFHARSEEARQSHTIHKLAVGTFAIEDAMTRGAPVEREVALLLQSVGGYGSDPLLDVTIASLPSDAVKEGTRTRAELHQKFGEMSIALRELSLVPSSGGGFFTHALARLVSAMKVKEYGEYSDGIEAVISKVERYLGEGRIADAADLLEKGVHGTQAQNLAAEWIRLARNRAVMEQALVLLQTHATAIASSLT